MLADTREKVAGPACPDDATMRSLWDSIAAVQALVLFDAKQVNRAEHRELEEQLGLTLQMSFDVYPGQHGDGRLNLVSNHGYIASQLAARAIQLRSVGCICSNCETNRREKFRNNRTCEYPYWKSAWSDSLQTQL